MRRGGRDVTLLGSHLSTYICIRFICRFFIVVCISKCSIGAATQYPSAIKKLNCEWLPVCLVANCFRKWQTKSSMKPNRTRSINKKTATPAHPSRTTADCSFWEASYSNFKTKTFNCWLFSVRERGGDTKQTGPVELHQGHCLRDGYIWQLPQKHTEAICKQGPG